MLSLEDRGSLDDQRSLDEPNQIVFFLKQLRDELDVETEAAALSKVQDAAISQIFRNHTEEELVILTEPEKYVLRYILASASDEFAFSDDLPSDPLSSICIENKEFYELKKKIDTTFGKELRDIESTPSILRDGPVTKPNMTLRVKAAVSVIMSHTYNRPVDPLGFEVRDVIKSITGLANQLVGPMRLTLVEQNEHPNIESAKKAYWASVHPQIRKNYTLLLEMQVLSVYDLPISRCQNMWLANFVLSKAFNLKRVDAGS